MGAPPTCSSCKNRTVCLPRAFERPGRDAEELAYARKRVKRDDVLYRMGAPFESMYAVKSGFFESRTATADGRDQVTAFHLPGDIVGMDGIATGSYVVDVIALEDTEVCIIPCTRLDEPDVHRHVRNALSRELVRANGAMLSMGLMRAEERLAVFLLGLSQRLLALGYARDDFHLRMSRTDIGSYLGMSLETVSRILTRFRSAGLITVDQRHIRIVDMPRLQAITSPSARAA